MHTHQHIHTPTCRHADVRASGCSYCPSSGAPVNTMDNFCGHCGAKLNCGPGPKPD